MKTSRHTAAQIIAILRQAKGGVPVAQLFREHGMSNASFYKWWAKYGGMDASMVHRMKGMEEDNRLLERMYSGLSIQNDLLKESPRNKVDRPSQRREIAESALERRCVSIALACRAFGVSETCYSYSPKFEGQERGDRRSADMAHGCTNE